MPRCLIQVLAIISGSVFILPLMGTANKQTCMTDITAWERWRTVDLLLKKKRLRSKYGFSSSHVMFVFISYNPIQSNPIQSNPINTVQCSAVQCNTLLTLPWWGFSVTICVTFQLCVILETSNTKYSETSVKRTPSGPFQVYA